MTRKTKSSKNSWLGFSIKMCRLKYPAFDPFKYYLYRIFYFVCSISLANFVMQFCLVGSRWNLSLEAEATLKSKCNWQPTRPNIENLRKRKKENVGTFWRAKKRKEKKNSSRIIITAAAAFFSTVTKTWPTDETRQIEEMYELPLFVQLSSRVQK